MRSCDSHVTIALYLMFSSQLNQVFSCSLGIIFNSPDLTTYQNNKGTVMYIALAATACRNATMGTLIALLAISPHPTYHCGLMSGSTMSFERLQVLNAFNITRESHDDHMTDSTTHLQMGTIMGFSLVPR